MVVAAGHTACFGVRSLMGLFFIFMISLVGIADMALSGHSSGGQDHMGAESHPGAAPAGGEHLVRRAGSRWRLSQGVGRCGHRHRR